MASWPLKTGTFSSVSSLQNAALVQRGPEINKEACFLSVQQALSSRADREHRGVSRPDHTAQRQGASLRSSGMPGAPGAPLRHRRGLAHIRPPSLRALGPSLLSIILLNTH